MTERHQDYQLTVPVVPPGGLINVPLQLDTDAPFALRLVRSRNIGLNGWRFKNAKGQYESNALRTDLIVSASALTAPSRGVPVYPEMIYPIGSSIVVDIGNATDENILNARLLFRGSKLFRDGSILAPTYPPKFSILPFIYPVVVRGVGPTGTSSTRKDNQLRIIHDADFVFSYGVADPFALGVEGQPVGASLPAPNATLMNWTELYVILRDEARKAYSNEPIHINDLFGQGIPSDLNTADLGVNFFPGLMTPQIYIERDHSLYFDLFRADDPVSSPLPIDVNFRFCGFKVFQR